METNQVVNEQEQLISEDQAKEILNQELVLVSEQERKELQQVIKTKDVIIIETHREKTKKLKKKYKNKFQITEGMVYDKDLHEKAVEAEREVRNYRTKTAEVDFDNLKAPYTTLLNFYNKSIKPVIEDLKEVQSPISDYVKKMKELKIEQDRADEIALEKRSNDRVKALIDAGAPFDGNYYAVGSEEFGVEPVSLGMDTINSVPDDIFEKFLKEITEKAAFIAGKQKEKAEAAAKEQEKKDNELKQLKEQNIRVRTRELKTLGLVPDVATDGVTVTTKQIEELSFEEWNTLFDGIEFKMEEEKKKVAKRSLVAARENELVTIGLTKSLTGYGKTYKDISIHISNNDLETFDDESWFTILNKAVSDIAKQKEEKANDDKKANEEKELATEREKELAPYWQFVTAEEKSTLGKMESAEYIPLFVRVKKQHSNKVDDDFKAEQSRIKDENEKKLSAQGDKAMYDDFLSRLREVSVPSVTTDEYKNKVATIVTFIKTLK